MIMRGTPGAPYSMGNVSANYPTVWFGGPVSQVYTGPRVRTRPRRRLRGLGDCMSYSDILTQLGGGSASCDPRDSACVMAGQQRANAAEDAIISTSCIPAGTPISFTPDTSQAALNAFMNNNPLAVPITVGGTTVTEIAGGGVSTNPPPPAPPPAQVVNPSPVTQSTSTGTSATSPGSAVSQANGGTAGSSGNVNSTTTEWISGVPDWVVVVGGGLLAFLILSRR